MGAGPTVLYPSPLTHLLQGRPKAKGAQENGSANAAKKKAAKKKRPVEYLVSELKRHYHIVVAPDPDGTSSSVLQRMEDRDRFMRNYLLGK